MSGCFAKNMNPFIEPNLNIIDFESAEWRHYANLSKDTVQQRWLTPKGKELLENLKKGDFTKSVIENYIGKFANKFDLRGIPLSKTDLSRHDLSDIDFFSSDFSQSSLIGAKLCGSYLSESNLRGACVNWADLDGALLDNVEFDKYTSFLGVDLHKVNFTFATLLYDLALTQQRIQQLERHNKIFAWFLRWSCDYGRSFGQYLSWVVIFVFSYAGIYWLLLGNSFLDSLYFSIVTFSTVGYGDILPHTPFEKILVISEIVIGYLMGGLLIAILAKRVIG